jgi:ferritin-like metal-binding protein YciE
MAKKQPVQTTLTNALIVKLKSLYDIEQQLTKALPKMAKAATNEDLKTAFLDHLEETKGHVKRLEQAFKHLNEKPKALRVEAIRGLVDDAKWVIDQKYEKPALDAMLIGAASYVEHYEMASYMAAARWARTINGEVASLLEQTLDEEQAADEKLSGLALLEVDPAVSV